MTTRPLESHAVRGIEGEPYELAPICAVPGCLERSRDVHHLFSRSTLGGAFSWVLVPEGSGLDAPDLRVGNLVGLCRSHHEAVTVGAAWITLADGGFYWSTLFDASQPLEWQPPFYAEPFPDGQAVVDHLHQGEVELERTEAPVPYQGLARTVADGSCPTCLRPLPHANAKDGKPEAKRMRRTWSLTVPVDERENGADVLDTLLEEGRKELARAGLPYGTDDTAKFFVASTVLALFVQHARGFLSDG